MIFRYYPYSFFSAVNPFSPYGYYNPYFSNNFHLYGGYPQPKTSVSFGASPSPHAFHVPLTVPAVHGH